MASWINLVLYTIELVLAFHYFTSYGNHGPRRFNLVVYLLAVNGMLGTISNCAMAWQVRVDNLPLLSSHSFAFYPPSTWFKVLASIYFIMIGNGSFPPLQATFHRYTSGHCQ